VLLGSDTGRRWTRWGLALLVLATVSFAALWFWAKEQDRFLHGGSTEGLTFGIAGLLLMVVLYLFGIRKRAYRSSVGKLETWLHSHIWLGLLAMLFILFHTGFRFEDGLALWAFGVLVAVVASGIVGVFLYMVMPRFFTDVGSNPPPEDASKDLQQIAKAMARTARGKSPEFQRVFRILLRRARPRTLAGWRLLFGRRRLEKAGEMPRRLKDHVQAVGKGEEDALRHLLVLSRQHEELERRLAHQQFFRNWLDVWLWIHLPLSLALIVLVVAHVVSAAWYGGALEWPGRLRGLFGL